MKELTNKWNNIIDSEYDKYELVVFENYPSSDREFNDFKILSNTLNNQNIPFIMILGPNQNYPIIKKISGLFPFKVNNYPLSDQKLKSNYYYDYNIETFYPGSLSFSVEYICFCIVYLCLYSIPVSP